MAFILYVLTLNTKIFWKFPEKDMSRVRIRVRNDLASRIRIRILNDLAFRIRIRN